MKLEDNIFATFLIDGKELPFPADQVSFSVSDSIHRMFSRMSMNLMDQAGYFQEYLLVNAGNIVELEFGTVSEFKNSLKSKFIIDSESLSELGINPSIFTGKIDIEFFHEWYNYQKFETNYYEGSASSVAQKLTSEYRFSSKSIDSTRANATWYQGGKTKSSFIKEVLLKKAYSSSSKNSPFFSFIDVNNGFHFNHYASLLKNEIAADFTYTFDKTQMDEENQSFKYSIIDIKRTSASLTKAKEHQYRKYITLENDGTTEIEDLCTEDFLQKNLKKTYNISNSKKQPVRFDFKYFGQEPDDSKLSHQSNLMREDLFRERFIILVPFNPKAFSGKTVELKLTLPNEENSVYSQRFDGIYLIESSDHIWDGPGRNAMTRLVVSRKYITVPKSYHIKELF